MKHTKITVFVVTVHLAFLNGCFIHNRVDCNVLFHLCIMNLSTDSVKIEVKKNDGFSSSVKSFSLNGAFLAPSDTITVTVDYSWTGTDGCSVSCNDEDYNGDLFLVDFVKEDSLIISKRVVPCKPCDKPRLGHVIVDYGEEITDTLYYRE